jgi:hypothetical protein
MDTQDHVQHSTCGTPSCSTFHLFCGTCGGRHHVSDEVALQSPAVARNTVPAPVSMMSRPAATNTA